MQHLFMQMKRFSVSPNNERKEKPWNTEHSEINTSKFYTLAYQLLAINLTSSGTASLMITGEQ